MNGNALALVFLGALCHALWNYFAKRASGGRPFVWLYGLISSILALPLVFFWPLASVHDSTSTWFPLIAMALASGIVHIFYALSLQQGYQSADLSVVYPIARGTGPLFAVFGAVQFLHEHPSNVGWLGISVILVGILCIAGANNLLRARNDSRLLKGIYWGIVTGLFIAVYTLLDAWAVKILSLHPLAFYSISLWFRTLLLAPFVLQDRPTLKRQWQTNRRHIIAVSILSPAAYLLTLYAMTMAPISYVAPVRELSMLFGTLFAAQLLAEENAKSRLLGTLCIALGVAILSVA